MRWLSRLSGRQRLWLVAGTAVALAIAAFGAVRQSAVEEAPTPTFTVEMSIKEVATPLKYYIFVAMVLLGLVYLLRLGRPDGSPAVERKTWYPRWPHMASLVLAVAVCGFTLGKSPNPMESAVKVFKGLVGLYPSVTDKMVAFGFFAGLVVIGNKLICGWACPFGALQELIHHLPILGKLKKRKLPFAVSNTLRITLFLVMLLMLRGGLPMSRPRHIRAQEAHGGADSRRENGCSRTGP